MFIPLALAVHLAASTAPDYSVDLFLVANNPTVLRDINWIEKPAENESVEVILRPRLKALSEAKVPFVVMDGADCTLFPKVGREIRYLARTFSGYDSMTESTTVNGKTKTKVLERAETEETMSGGVYTNPIGKRGYISQVFLHFNHSAEPRIFLTLQDPNSYRTACEGNRADDKMGLAESLLISSDSVGATSKFLREQKVDFKGICISQWGIPDPAQPNVIAFPPEGRVAHYKLSRTGGVWGVKLVEYLSRP